MLKIDKLTIRFGGLVAVSDLSFEIRQGQIFGLIGPNGAGKTTCFNMISGTYPPTSGAIEFLGRRIDGLPMFRINALGIARTYQNINLFGSMTILENVMVGQHSRGACGLPSSILRLPKQKAEERRIIEKAEEVLGFVGLSGKENHCLNLQPAAIPARNCARAIERPKADPARRACGRHEPQRKDAADAIGV